MFSYKVFKTGNDVLLAICDDEILGKTFSAGEIEITVSEFYKGGKCNEAEALKLVRKATIINAVGNRIIKLLAEKNMVSSDSVLKIGDVLHAQVVAMN